MTQTPAQVGLPASGGPAAASAPSGATPATSTSQPPAPAQPSGRFAVPQSQSTTTTSSAAGHVGTLVDIQGMQFSIFPTPQPSTAGCIAVTTKAERLALSSDKLNDLFTSASA